MAERSRTRRNTLERRCLGKAYKRLFVGSRRAFSRCSRRSRRHNVLLRGAFRADQNATGPRSGPLLLVSRRLSPGRSPGSLSMPFAYYAKLSPARQRIYRKSDAIETLRAARRASTRRPVRGGGSATGSSPTTAPACERAARSSSMRWSRGYRVPPIRVRVLAQRPADDYGELHGLYEPEERTHAGAHHRLDAHRAAQQRRRFQDVPAHAHSRGLPSSRLRALRARGDVPHRGLLQARVDARRRAARAGE